MLVVIAVIVAAAFFLNSWHTSSKIAPLRKVTTSRSTFLANHNHTSHFLLPVYGYGLVSVNVINMQVHFVHMWYQEFMISCGTYNAV